MKSVIISLCIAAAMIASGIAYEIHIENVSERLSSINTRVMQAISEEDYTAAKYILDKETDFLEKQQTILAITDNHEVTEKIEMAVRELREYIDGEQKTDAMSKCRVITFLIEHLPENHELKLDNVL